jgi:hypothetical protein
MIINIIYLRSKSEFYPIQTYIDKVGKVNEWKPIKSVSIILKGSSEQVEPKTN